MIGARGDLGREFEIQSRRYDDPTVTPLIAAVQAEYVRRYGGGDGAPVDPSQFDPPNGLFLLGLLDHQPVAIGGWRWIGEREVEIKRMFVLAAARGQGLARRVLSELERTAAAAGAGRVVLNTGSKQPEAIALYESSGYQPSAGFGYYTRYSSALFYAKELSWAPYGPAVRQAEIRADGTGPPRSGHARDQAMSEIRSCEAAG